MDSIGAGLRLHGEETVVSALDAREHLAHSNGQRVLTGEVAPDGVFGPLHAWLDERMAADESEGFFRPYDEDRGGVAPERWHLSYAPLALAMERALSPAMLQACWSAPGCEPRWREQLQADLDSLWQRYVSVPADWCPEDYRRAP